MISLRAEPTIQLRVHFSMNNFFKFDLNYGSHKSSTYSLSKFHKSNSKWDRVVPSNVKKSNSSTSKEYEQN